MQVDYCYITKKDLNNIPVYRLRKPIRWGFVVLVINPSVSQTAYTVVCLHDTTITKWKHVM